FYEAYYDWYNDGGNVYGVLALKGDRFAMRNFSKEFNELGDGEEPMFDVGGYLYAAPCNHVSPEYSEYVAPTCMDKGCKEYWYCVYCGGYFADEACTDAYGHKPILPALDHIYGDTACNHCGREIPVYTKITSYDQFTAIKPGASFIAVAEIDDGNGGLEYYVLKQPLNIVGSDIDEDGVWDILLIDEDQNGVSDVLEQDLDGDGIADAMRVDGFWSEETLDGVLDEMEIEQYLFELEMEYTGGYMPGSSLLDAIPVTPDAEGGITVKNMGALEFVMERVIPDDKLDEQYYGDGATKKDYENDFIFRVPNFWIRPMVMVDNNLYQMPYEEGDSRVWGVLFGDDVKAIGNAYFDETFPDDAVVMYTEPFYSLNNDGELAHALRFLVNGDEKHFWMTSYSYWEETVGTEIPIYLYCSDAGEGWHEHIYGPWSKQNDETHVRYCTVDGCTEYDIGGHHVDYESERTPDTDNPELGHWVACTDCGANIHEYHTREEYNYRYDMWRDAEDGVHHYVNCEVCGGVAVYEEHDWGEWSWNGIWNNETQQYDYMHRRSCECFPCPGEEWRVECIYDEGVVTVEPTCTEPGVITYTCIVSGCTMETHSYTEEIPAIGHAWGEWEPTENANVEQRVCANDPTHTEERELVHEHVLGDLNYGYPATFVEDGVIDHYRCGGCEAYFDANKEEVDSIVIPKLSTDLSVCVNGIPVSLLLTEQDENMLVWTLEGLSVTQGDVITVCQTDDTEITYSYFAGGDGNNVDTEGKILTTASSADVMLTWTPNGLMLSVSGYKYPGIVIEINGVQYPMHFVTYLDGETTSYIYGYVELFAGDRLVVVDNVNDLVYGYDDIAASSAWNTWDYHRGENGEIVVDFATRYGIE
ncbi:MAG: hypothetical protein IJD82_01845, partial [Clostridia bacterium]|nr:hypothetical protein [Clostridia bacterium]